MRQDMTTEKGQQEPMLELRSLAKTFTKPVGVAGHIANLFGAGVKRIDVRAVAGIDLSVRKGRSSGSSAIRLRQVHRGPDGRRNQQYQRRHHQL